MVSKEVKDEIYAGVYFDTTLKELDLDPYEWRMGDPVEERAFVMGTAGERGSPIISSTDGSSVLCVYNVINGEPPISETQMIDPNDIDELLPRRIRNSNKKAVLSLKGQYLEVMEWTAKTKSDGTNVLRSKNGMHWIPVEWVRKRLRYDTENTEFQP